jgi:hypothetical protein
MGIKRAVESCAIQKKVVNLFANREIASNAMARASLNSAVFWGGDLSNQELIEGCSLHGIDGMCAVMDDFFVAADSITYCHLIKLTEIVGTLDTCAHQPYRLADIFSTFGCRTAVSSAPLEDQREPPLGNLLYGMKTFVMRGAMHAQFDLCCNL